MATAREAILDAAVRHFAQHGFSGASLREIMRDAQVNLASAHYHFGSKEAVYRETVGRYLTRLCKDRLAALEKLGQQSGGTKPQLRIAQLVRAYVEPHIRLCKDPAASDYVRLLARFSTENDELTEAIYTEFLAPVRSRYVQAFAAAAPQIPTAVMLRLFSFMVSLMVTAPADSSYESLTGKSPWPSDPDELTEQLVAFVTAGFIDAAQRSTSAKGAQRNSGKLKPDNTAKAKSKSTARKAAKK